MELHDIAKKIVKLFIVDRIAQKYPGFLCQTESCWLVRRLLQELTCARYYLSLNVNQSIGGIDKVTACIVKGVKIADGVKLRLAEPKQLKETRSYQIGNAWLKTSDTRRQS